MKITVWCLLYSHCTFDPGTLRVVSQHYASLLSCRYVKWVHLHFHLCVAEHWGVNGLYVVMLRGRFIN